MYIYYDCSKWDCLDILRFIVDPSIFMYSIIATVIYFLSFKYTPSVLIDKIQGIIIEDMNDVLVIFDNCGKLLYTNKKGKELALLGKYDKNDVCLNDIEKYCQDHIDRFNNSLLSISYNNQVLYFDIETNEIKDYKKRLQASVYLFHDVTLRETEKRLRTYETSHDDVTGIYNRRYFLEQASKIYNTCKDKYDILVTNFEGFRVVNEMLGVDGGNIILKQVGNALTAIDNKIGIIYGRMEGDKFAILIKSAKLPDGLKLIKESIDKIINRTPLVLKIGIANICDDNIESA